MELNEAKEILKKAGCLITEKEDKMFDQKTKAMITVILNRAIGNIIDNIFDDYEEKGLSFSGSEIEEKVIDYIKQNIKDII
jgi:hypothetical protein